MSNENNERVKVEMEFFIKSSPAILYNYISNASGLAEWFADNVSVRGSKNMIFTWDDDEEREAEILKNVPKKGIRFRWMDEEDKNEFWELEIRQDDLTNDVLLFITDYCYADETDQVQELWASQIEDLKSSIGA